MMPTQTGNQIIRSQAKRIAELEQQVKEARLKVNDNYVIVKQLEQQVSEANNRASLAMSLSGDLLDDKQETINQLEKQAAELMEELAKYKEQERKDADTK
jgi:hypothetical protein